MKILFNEEAFGGNAQVKLKSLNKKNIFNINSVKPDQMNKHINKLILDHEVVNLAGGDGTFHFGINFILKQHPDFFEKNVLGLIGTGSSNSLLKSLSDSTSSAIPFYLDRAQPIDIDLGEIQFKHQSHYFLANGSVGLLALGNYLFNHPKCLVRWAKRFSTELANFIVFLQLLKKYKPIHLTIKSNNQVWEGYFLNVQFLKARFYTGGYSFPTKNKMDSGFFDVHLFYYKSKWQTLKTFLLLSFNLTQQLPNHESFQSKELEISSRTPYLIEIDGEIYESTNFHIYCHQKKIKIAGQSC